MQVKIQKSKSLEIPSNLTIILKRKGRKYLVEKP